MTVGAAGGEAVWTGEKLLDHPSCLSCGDVVCGGDAGTDLWADTGDVYSVSRFIE